MKRLIIIGLFISVVTVSIAQKYDPSYSGRVEILTTSGTLDFPTSLATGCDDLTITVQGAQLGDAVIVGAPNGSVPANSTVWGWVSSVNTVTVRHCTHALVSNPGSGSFRVAVVRLP